MTNAINRVADDATSYQAELKTPADKALLARITRFFVDAIVDLSPSDKTAALLAREDILAVIETVARRPAAESARYAVKLHGAIQKRKILEAEGGVLGPSQVAKLLGISRQAVSQRRMAGKLLAVPIAGGFTYPIWQFHDGKPIDGMEYVFAALDDIDPWMQMAFFLNKNGALGNHRPLDVLLRGDTDKVVRAAHTHLEQGPG